MSNKICMEQKGKGETLCGKDAEKLAEKKQTTFSTLTVTCKTCLDKLARCSWPM